MDYIGSKVKLNDWMFSIIKEVMPPRCIFLDACAGSGAVSRYAAKEGYTVISNDLMAFSKAVTNGSIGITERQKKLASDFIKNLNTLEGSAGFFSKQFSDNGRLYFTPENARLIDAIRAKIETIRDKKVKDYLIYCGVEALSRVNNTAGVQAAFLKKFKEAALRKYLLKEEPTVDGIIFAYNMDILKLLNDSKFRRNHKEDILYIDPPYNQRQYGPNYHLYETFVRYDSPELKGKTGLRNNWKEESGSLFCTKDGCLKFLIDVVNSSKAKYIFVSYSTDGLLKEKDIIDAFPNRVKVFKKEQRRYKSDSSKNREYVSSDLYEYLFQISNL